MSCLLAVACGDDDRPSRGDGGVSPDATITGRCDNMTDTDGDGLWDDFEGSDDVDGDGIPNFMDTDSDGDGFDDRTESGEQGGCSARNSDADAFPDYLDNDSDGDGLGDREEAETYFTDPYNPDTDGDGFPDAAEVATMSDPNDPSSTVDPEDFFVVLPFGGPEERRNLTFGTEIRKADVFFMVDSTGSMRGEISNLQSGLSSLVDRLVMAIPDIGVGFGQFAGFGGVNCTTVIGVEACSDGRRSDLPFELNSVIVTDRAQMQTAVGTLDADSGGAIWASSTEAIYQAATGEGIGRWVPPQSCPTIPDEVGRRFGYPCFRPGSLPIIVPITDTSSKNGPGNSPSQNYDPADFAPEPAPHTLDQTRFAALGIGARVFGIISGDEVNTPDGPGGPSAISQAEWWATETGTVDAAGSPIAFMIGSDGSGLTDRIVDAIQQLSSETPQDITTRTEDSRDIPEQSPPVDATLMIKAITPVAAYDGMGIEIPESEIARDDIAFYGVTPGVRVEFEITFLNDVVPAASSAQIFLAKIIVVGNGVADLDEREVIILVPAGSGPLI
ncbi:MAG TPA: hypothetical protein RMG45_03105 [Polyangiaceae bacterium LLY-WYZ-15_(1-7)]|nr:hypothetical protein [Polyangiaceae bacterium LLY-WYZ-15_(1-7)]